MDKEKADHIMEKGRNDVKLQSLGVSENLIDDNELSQPSFDEDDLYGKDDNGQEKSAPIMNPFDPRKVNIVTQTYVVATIVERMKSSKILMVLNPDYQRLPGLWTDVQQSRLIESMIIRIPIPTFYFDENEDDVLTVVDGLQRLYTIKRFMALDQNDSNRLRLENLEYLPEYNGKIFEELPVNIQTRIKETNLLAYVIRPGTPNNVRTSIFTRINTGGIQLTAAEIRNSVYRGQAAELLRELAHSSEFVVATNNKVHPERMQDCELVNRFLAFYILEFEKDYNENLEDYLNKVLNYLQQCSDKQLELYKKEFKSSMVLCHDIFGNIAFRKRQKNEKYGRINKPLFECISVVFAECTENERDQIRQNKETFLKKYDVLLHNGEFVDSITMGTAKKENIEKRYGEIRKIVRETLGKQ